jgi:hypothetical protein
MNIFFVWLKVILNLEGPVKSHILLFSFCLQSIFKVVTEFHMARVHFMMLFTSNSLKLNWPSRPQNCIFRWIVLSLLIFYDITLCA